jgi:hypothetical protein
MKQQHLFAFIILFIITTASFGQITDTIRVKNSTESVDISTDKNAILLVKLNDTLNIRLRVDSLGVYKTIDTLRRLTKLDSLQIRMDSLLNPYYSKRFDSLKNNMVYKPRYRMTTNTITQDTVYKPIPKVKKFIAIKRRLIIDPLEILNPIELTDIDTTKFAADPIWWKNRNSFGIDINQAAFLNWNAGGNNSIAGLLKANVYRSYKKVHTLWDSEILVRYGLNSQQDQELRKTDDKIQVNSTFGYRKDTLTNWYYSVKFNFNTQFTDGFSYPNTEEPISRLFAPAYIFLGAGAFYDLKKKSFSIYLSPFTLKSTLVLDETLSNEGVFGVPAGDISRNEFGALIQGSWDTEVFKNVIMKARLNLYSDYLNDFGNIDVTGDINFVMIINKYMKANLGAYLIYDDDIKFKEDTNGDGTLETLGARLQLKQLLGIGVLFNF